MTKEAGAEFVANLTEDLLNTHKYEELQKGKFDLNLKASAGVSAKAKFYKWVNLSSKWDILSGSLKINTWKLVPTFQKPTVTVNSFSTATATVIPSEKLLFPVSIGLGVWDKDETLHDAQYCSNTYRVFEDWGLTQYQTTFSGLKPNQIYRVKPLVKMLGLEIMASPSESFKTKELPVKITDFKQTGSQYKENGFTHEGRSYSYKYDVAVTVELSEAEGVEEWGYAYKDPFGEVVLISLKNYGTRYTDTRYSYFRNQDKSTITLYEFVKYEGEQDYVYGEPKDYEVSHGLTCCPDEHHPHMIDLGLPSGTKWACCNVGADKPEEYGGYYAWGETEEKDNYNFDTYIYCDGSYNTYHDLGSDIAGTQYDVAHVKWGGSWVMPSREQQSELRDNCTYEQAKMNGVSGVKFTSKSNGGSIFLPLAGFRRGGGRFDARSTGHYWSSTQYPWDSDCAYELYIAYPRYTKMDYRDRYRGQSVRPISR